MPLTKTNLAHAVYRKALKSLIAPTTILILAFTTSSVNAGCNGQSSADQQVINSMLNLSKGIDGSILQVQPQEVIGDLSALNTSPMLSGETAVEQASAGRVVRVGVYQNAPKIYVDSDERPAGIFIDLLNEIARVENWQLEYVPGEWSACLDALEEHSIDLLPDVAFTRERDKLLDFNGCSVIESWSQVYAHTSGFNTIADLEGHRVATLKDAIQTNALQQLMDGLGFRVMIIEAGTFEEAFELASNGTADAAISNYFFGNANYQQYNLKTTPIIFNPVELYFASAQGNNADLLEVIDQHLLAWKTQPGSPYYTALEHWIVLPPEPSLPQHLKWIWTVILGLLALASIFIILLRMQVKAETLKLRNTHSQLEIASERLTRLTDSNIIGIVILNTANRIVQANEYFTKLIGYTKETSIENNVNWRDLTPLDWHSRDELAFNELLEDGVCAAYEKEFLHCNGDRIPVLVALTLLPGSEQEIAAFVLDIKHIKSIEKVLRAIRNVNQLIVQENDPKELVAGVCRNLTENRGYQSALMLLMDQEHNPTHWYEVRIGGQPNNLLKCLKNYDEASCITRSMRTAGVVSYIISTDTCGECPLRALHEKNGALSARLEHEGEIYGVLAVTLEPERIKDEEERRLFTEVAGDVGLALHAINLEEAHAMDELNLRKSEKRYKQVFDNNPIGIYRTTPDGRILLANPAMIHMLGYETLEQLSMRNLEEEKHYLAHYPRSQFKERIERERSITGLESAWGKPDGSVVYVRENARIIRDDSGKVAYYEGTAEDITQQKEAELALRRSEERYRRLAESTRAIPWEADADSACFTYIGSYVEQLLGYPRESWLEPGAFAARLHPDDRKRVLEEAQLANKRGVDYSIELRMVAENGQDIWLQNEVTLIHVIGKSPKAVGHAFDITDKKRIQQELETEIALRRALVEHSRDGIVVLDGNGRVVEANRRFTDMLGYSIEELQSLSVRDWDDAFTRESVQEMLDEVDESGDHFETRHRRKDGSVFNVEISSNGVQTSGRKLILCVCRDVTERKLSERALQESEARFRALFEYSVDGILVSDTHSRRFSQANRSICKMLGYTQDELLNLSVDEIHPPDDLLYVHEVFEAQIRGDIQHAENLPCLRKDGSVFYADISAASATIDGQIALIGFFRDVTESHMAEQQLRESEERYRLLAENISDVIWVADLNMQETYISPSVERQLGFSVEEALAREPFTDVTPSSAELARCALMEELERDGQPGVDPNRTRILELEYYRKDGTAMWAEVQASFVRDTAGIPIAVLGVNRDITERKETEARLRSSHDELRAAHEQLKLHQVQLIQAEKLASLGQLAAGIAHEINNPIAFVKSNLGTLQDYIAVLSGLLEANCELAVCAETGDDHGIAKAREKIRILEEKEDISFMMTDIDALIKESISGTKRIRDIVQDLRSFAHAGKDNAECADINEIIETSLRITWNELKYKCSVEMDLQAKSSLMCYPERLSQVIVNMLVNAAQAIENHGTIRVTTDEQDKQIVVRVSDTGSGIPPEILPKLFDPFFTTKAVGLGTGLGLAISHATIDNHNGTIEVESEVGVGTTFTIKLPLQGIPDD